MSQENVEIVGRIYEAAARRDAAAVLALYDPEVEVDFTRAPLGGLTQTGVFRGLEDLRRFFREYYEVWENLDDNYDDLFAVGEQVISVATVSGRGRASGLEIQLSDQAGLWTLRDGRVIRVVWFPTRAEALEAAGLSE
jgi:ketosteroid isomerase-like protein